MNKLFPQEYTGDIYAAHAENTWMTYNPYQYTDVTDASNKRTFAYSTKRAKGNVPFQYNTAKSIDMEFSPYSMAVMKEYTDKIHIYATNYRNTKVNGQFPEGANETDIFTINGAGSQPTITWKDRGDHRASTVTTEWKDGKYIITVSHTYTPSRKTL